MDIDGNSDKDFYDLADYFERLGLQRLARDIRHEARFAKLLDATLLADRWNFESDFLERREEKIQDFLQEFQTRTLDTAQTYNNVILTLGYAGLFAIWNFVNNQLSTFDRALIAFLAGFSLLVFVLWTLVTSMRTLRTAARGASVYSKEYPTRDELLEAIEKQRAFETRNLAGQMRWYPAVFLLSAATGFAAALLLSAFLAGQIAGHPFTVGGILDTSWHWIASK